MSALPVSSAAFSSFMSSPVNDRSSKGKDGRNTVKFHPSIWGDEFLTYDESQDFVVEKRLIEELKKEVRKELMIKGFDEPVQHMKLIIELIDLVQRLGLAYHFEDEIEDALKHVYITYGDSWIHKDNLESLSLWFRLLRHQGFDISSEIFKNHMDKKGNFKASICNDAQGMLALYEATYMSVEGEQVLDDALEFTKIHLGMIAKDPSCDSSLRTQIQQALNQPLRKRFSRLEAVSTIPLYQQQPTHNKVLLKLAKLDFNILQSMHKKELSQLYRWSIGCLDVLPKYMKLIYEELMNFNLEMEESLEKEGKTYQIDYVKEMMKEYVGSLLIEAKWVKDGYMPTLEEYMSNSLLTCGNVVIIAASYACVGDMVTEDIFKWLATHPPLVKASCLILRLMNDIATHQEEQERCHIASSIECYQKETGASKEEACEFLSKKIENAWKVINQESLRPTQVPFPLVIPVINSARACDAIYKGNDGFNHAGETLINYIKSLINHPILD